MKVPEVDVVEPDEARQLLDDALAPYLADGWTVLDRHDFMARLNRGEQNLEFYVGLTGEITIDEKPLSLIQSSGRVVAWLLLLLTFLIVVGIASILGWL